MVLEDRASNCLYTETRPVQYSILLKWYRHALVAKSSDRLKSARYAKISSCRSGYCNWKCDGLLDRTILQRQDDGQR